MRWEPRIFRTPFGETGIRIADLEDPDALIPRGTVFVCSEGHEIAEAAYSLHSQMKLSADAFCNLRPGVVTPHERLDYHQPLAVDEPAPEMAYCGICGKPPVQFTREWSAFRHAQGPVTNVFAGDG